MTDSATPSPAVILYLRIAMLVPALLFTVGFGFSVFLLLTEGANVTVFFPSRRGPDEINAVAGAIIFGVAAAFCFVASWVVPRSVARVAAQRAAQEDETSEP